MVSETSMLQKLGKILWPVFPCQLKSYEAWEWIPHIKVTDVGLLLTCTWSWSSQVSLYKLKTTEYTS